MEKPQEELDSQKRQIAFLFVSTLNQVGTPGEISRVAAFAGGGFGSKPGPFPLAITPSAEQFFRGTEALTLRMQALSGIYAALTRKSLSFVVKAMEALIESHPSTASEVSHG
ncbi:MAG TPA: hypothetical protein PKB02_10625 [Anaerohalosphaeraceae bacterium]|nr:hypothetical protein [Anaerohalosphaeraceae bacterium]